MHLETDACIFCFINSEDDKICFSSSQLGDHVWDLLCTCSWVGKYSIITKVAILGNCINRRKRKIVFLYRENPNVNWDIYVLDKICQF